VKRPKHWYCQTWKMNFYYFLGWPPSEFKRYMRKRHGYEYDDAGKAASTLECVAGPHTVILIWVRDRKDLPALAHEAVHAANWTLARRGWRADMENDEPQAYLVESIFRGAQ
jgi:hypothetical protein